MSPALLTSVSSRPSSPTTRSTALSACRRSVTSPSTTRALPPSARIAAATSSSRSRRRGSSATVAPSAARLCAVAAPMPLLAPVTSATVPWSFSVMVI
jgi:hypothetical protein